MISRLLLLFCLCCLSTQAATITLTKKTGIMWDPVTSNMLGQPISPTTVKYAVAVSPGTNGNGLTNILFIYDTNSTNNVVAATNLMAGRTNGLYTFYLRAYYSNAPLVPSDWSVPLKGSYPKYPSLPVDVKLDI